MFYKYILSITCFDTLILGHFEGNKTYTNMQTNIWVTFCVAGLAFDLSLPFWTETESRKA